MTTLPPETFPAPMRADWYGIGYKDGTGYLACRVGLRDYTSPDIKIRFDPARKIRTLADALEIAHLIHVAAEGQAA